MLTFGTLSLRTQLLCCDNLKSYVKPTCTCTRWQLVSIASHVSEPSQMSSPNKTSDNCSPSWHLIENAWDTLSKHHPSQPSQPTQPWGKISCWYFKLVNVVVVYYVAIDDCNNLCHIELFFLNNKVLVIT